MIQRRIYPIRPIVGVGVLVQREDMFLIVKRGSEPDKGLWSIPGGIVELGEKVTERAVLEVKEETCIDVELKKLIGVIDKIVLDEEGKTKYHFIIIDYLAELIRGEVNSQDDALDAKWVTACELKRFELTPTFVDLLKSLNIF
jgi:ADP-ribose pyrophosphatase